MQSVLPQESSRAQTMRKPGLPLSSLTGLQQQGGCSVRGRLGMWAQRHTPVVMSPRNTEESEGLGAASSPLQHTHRRTWGSHCCLLVMPDTGTGSASHSKHSPGPQSH